MATILQISDCMILTKICAQGRTLLGGILFLHPALVNENEAVRGAKGAGPRKKRQQRPDLNCSEDPSTAATEAAVVGGRVETIFGREERLKGRHPKGWPSVEILPLRILYVGVQALRFLRHVTGAGPSLRPPAASGGSGTAIEGRRHSAHRPFRTRIPDG